VKTQKNITMNEKGCDDGVLSYFRALSIAQYEKGAMTRHPAALSSI
jgi:hypothetical protein